MGINGDWLLIRIDFYALSLGFVVFLIGLVNFFPSIENNWNIAVLQSAFLLCSVLIFRGFPSGLGGGAVVLFLIACAIFFSNFLVVRDGVGLGDWWRVFELLAHAGFALALFLWFSRHAHALHWVVGGLLLAILFYFVVLLSTWLSLDDPVHYDWFSLPPLFQHIRHLGYFLCVGTVFSAWGVLVYTGWRRVVTWCIYLLAASMLLWSGGRGAFIAACGGVALLFLAFPSRERLWGWVGLCAGMLLAFLLSALFQVEVSGLGWLSAIYRTGASTTADQLVSSRFSIWLYLLDYIAERPWFGWGGEGFRAVWMTPNIVQAHNGLLQLLIEWGVAGTFLIGGSLFWLLMRGVGLYWRSCGNFSSDDALPLGISLVAALLLLSLVDGVFYHGTPMAFLMIGYGMVAATVYHARGVVGAVS